MNSSEIWKEFRSKSNQRPPEESERSTSRSNVTQQSSIDNQFDKLILEMRCLIRDVLIAVLNQLSELLSNDDTTILNQVKDKLIRNIDDLVTNLSNLLTLRSTSHVQCAINQPTAEFVLISREIKIKLINHLIKNKDYAILYRNTATSEMRRQLANENCNLVAALFNLPKKLDETVQISKKPNPIGWEKRTQKTKDNDEFVPDEVSQEPTIEMHAESLNSNSLNESLNQMRIRDETDCKAEEVKFTFEIDISKLNRFPRTDSQFFHHLGVKWYLSIQLEQNRTKVAMYLYCINSTVWTIRTKLDLILLGRYQYIPKRMVSFTCTYRPNKEDFYGCTSLISPNDLREGSGYVKNSKLFAQLYLNAELLGRSN